MTDPQFNFYECENPACGLRFPGQEGAPRWNRCPLCRSNTHIVAEVNSHSAPKLQEEARKTRQVEALLDNLRSAWNVGSIFRTSDGLGIAKIHLCGISPTADNPKLYKTALGAELSLPWEHHNNGVKLAQDLKSRGYLLWAFEDIPGAIPLYQVDFPEAHIPLVLVVGNEMCGVDPGILEQCQRIISIPMLGIKRSYNVAIAFAIAASYVLNKIEATE